jgi:hypothetical protein
MSVYSLASSDRDIFNLTPPTAVTDVITRDDYNSTIVGDQAGRETIGELNSFYGYRTGASNRSGYRNVFIGALAGEQNARGDNNVLIGTEAGKYITTARGNVIIGNKAGFSNNGNFNVFIGYLNTVTASETSYCNLTMGYDTLINGNNNMSIGNKSSITSTNSIVFGNTSINTGNNNIVIGGSIRNQASNVLIINNRHNSNLNSNSQLTNYADGYMNINDYIVANQSNNVNTLTLTNDVITMRSSNVSFATSAGVSFETQNAKFSISSDILLTTYGQFATQLLLSSNVFLGSSNIRNLYVSSSNAVVYINSNIISLSNDWGRFAIDSNVMMIGGSTSNMAIVLEGSNNKMTLCNGDAYLDSKLQVVRNATFRSNVFFNSNTTITHDGDISLSNNYVYRVGGVGETHFTQNVCFSNSYPNGVMTFCNVSQGIKNWENITDNERQEFYGSTIIQKNLFVGGMIYSSGINSGSRLVLSSGANQWNQYVAVTSNLNPYLVFESSTGTILRFGDTFQPEQLNFTGKHRCSMKERISDEYVGRIVCATGDYMNLDSKKDISIDESIPVIELSTRSNDSRAFGVISAIEPASNKRCFRLGNIEMLMRKRKDDIRVIVNSVGEGGIWVCNANGNLMNGDLITCSHLPGYAMKQNDDVIRSYTVAKITCDCNFDDTTEYSNTHGQWIPVIINVAHEGINYKVAFVGCVYKF